MSAARESVDGMKRRYRYRIIPGERARGMMARTFGCCRVVHNDFLRLQDEHRKAGGKGTISVYDAQKLLLTVAKKTAARAWLSEVSNQALQQSVADAGTAYRNFFASLRGIRKGRKMGAPRRKKRAATQSFRLPRTKFEIRGGWENTGETGGRLRLEKIGWVSVRWHRPLPAAPSSVTIIQDATGRYWASFVVDVDQPAPLPETGRTAGVDLGLTDFATVVYSDGTREKIPAPKKYRAAQRKLARTQRALSRTQKRSGRRRKAAARVARIHQTVANQRRDHAQQLTARLIRENQAITVEKLSITGMARGRLAKSIHDAGWGTFLQLLQEKATTYGRTIHVADRAYPSTRTCSQCGHVDGPKPLSVRVWECPACSAHLDRDYNAAVNLLLVAAGPVETQNARGEHVRPAALPAALSETRTHRTAIAA
jgi:putative transposase